MKKTTALLLTAFCIFSITLTSCRIYSFTPKGTLDPEIKTVNVHIIENQAPYVNPQLLPNLTDRVKQKITRQTKLSQTNRSDADLDIRGVITDYSQSTTGVTNTNGQTQASVNRLTVSVRMTITNQLKKEDPKDVTVSRSFDFPANQTLNQAEAQLLDEMIRNLTDEIFNRIFSDW
ncbi:MAG TPA: LptE family protein [Flavisolibacter sp.]|nr:LptE family protein [Flavisolibacter sp.]